MRLVSAIFLALLAAVSASASAQTSPASPPVRTLNPAQLSEDLARLRFTLERAHPNLYRYRTRSAMNALFEDAAAGLRRPMTNLEFYRRLAPLVAAVRDSHTSVQPPEDLLRFFRSNSRAVFPLDLRYVGDRAFVEADLGDRPAVRPGSELLSIDGRPMARITERLLAGMAEDGFNQPSKLSRLDVSFWYFFSTAFGPATRYPVRVRDPENGLEARYVLDGIPPRRLAERERGAPQDSQRLELPGDGIAVLTLDELSDPNTGTFLRDSFRRVAAAHVGDLVIDLRNCPGGDDRFNNQLLSYLIDRPFRFYWNRNFTVRSYDDLRYVDYGLDDFITPEQAAQLPAAQRTRPLAALTLPELLRFMLSVDQADGVFRPAAEFRFAGRVYLLVGGNSASSAAEIAALFHHLGIGTIIGEEPNGAYRGLTAGAIPIITLPNSGVRVRIPLIAYHNAVAPGIFEGRGAPPAFPVARSLADAVAGVDTVMVFTRNLIRARRENSALSIPPR